MGQSESSFQRTYEETVSQLSSVQLGEIAARFNELYGKAGGPKGHLVDREAFSRYFRLPVAVGDRLFDAFDKKKNGRISFEEFVCGLAVLLHGSFNEKCKILFQVFNIHGDEGISREELTTMLSAIHHSTNTILSSVTDSDNAVMYGENREQAVKRMVDAAFKNCDITRTGKLLPLEFEYWLKRNPKVLDCLLAFNTREGECTLGPLLMSPTSTITPTPTHTITTSCHPSPKVQLFRRTSSPLEVSHQSQTFSPIPMTASEPCLTSVTIETSETTSVSMATADSPVAQDIVQPSQPAPEYHPTQAQPDTPVLVAMEPSSPTLMQLATSESETSLQEEGQELSTGSDLNPTLIEKEASAHDSGERYGDVTLIEDPLEGVEDQTGGRRGSVPSEEEPLEDRTGQGRASVTFEEEPQEDRTGGEHGDVIFLEEPLEGVKDQADYSGSIMQSEDSMAATQRLDMSEVLEALSSDIEPSSPVLPTTMETIFVEEDEEEEAGQEEGELLSFSSNELEEPNLDELEEAAVRSRSISESLPEVTTTVPDNGEAAGEAQPTEEVTATETTTQEVETTTQEVETTTQEVETTTQEVETTIQEVVTTIQEVTTPQGVAVPRDDLPQPQRRPSPYPRGEAEVKEALYTAWLPSPWTQELLANPPPSTTTQHLTCPGLVADIKMDDPIGDLLSSKFPDAPRKPLLSVEHVSMDAEGLQKLVLAGCYHAALELTSRFLSAHGQGLGQAGQPTMHTHKTLQMWTARAALLMHARRYKDLELELAAFRELDNPDLYYQYHSHSYPGKKGSLVPFSLRLLHAQLPGFTGSPQLALDRLCRLQWVCEQILSELKHSRLPWTQEPLSAEDQQAAEAVWKERLVRVKFSLGNCFVRIQDYSMAVEVYESIAEEVPMLKAELYSGIGRLYLQLGDLHSAQKYFSCVTTIASGDTSKLIHVKINEALLNVFLSKWQAARDCFEAVLTMEPNNLMVQSNHAVCVFFQGRLKEAIGRMESLLRSCPPLSLQPGIFANLSAAYDLESGGSQSKKLAFLPLLGQQVGDGFHLPSLNIR